MGVFMRLPRRDADQLRHYAGALGMSTAGLARSLIHAKLQEAQQRGAMMVLEAHTIQATPGGNRER